MDYIDFIMNMAVRFDGVVKEFSGVRVLHGVSFDLAPGRTVGLLGENGAGKSTLMKILAGYEEASGGSLSIDGTLRHFAGSREAEAAGIVLIHQEFNLAEDLTIAQNIYLGHEKRKRFGLLDDAAMRAGAAQVLAQVGLARDPDTPVRELIVAEKQRVEIAKALARQARLLIMDEPTATLTPGETEALFALMSRLKADGVTIVYISHKLDEVERVTDEVVVMRDGRFVARRPTADLSRHQMASLMVGRELADLYPAKDPAPDAGIAPLLKVQGLDVPGWAEQIGFELRPGEILGFAGLVGAGRTELARLIYGADSRTSGEVFLQGKRLSIHRPEDSINSGVVYLTEDRKHLGLFLDLTVRENVNVSVLWRDARMGGILNLKSGKRRAAEAIRALGIRVAADVVPVGSLSGGNQQKVLLSRLLETKPKVLILDEPTRGVDIGAKVEIYNLMNRLTAEGAGIIMISSELPELLGMSDRVLVMHRGRVQTVLERGDATEERVVGAALGLDPTVRLKPETTGEGRLKPDTTTEDDPHPGGVAG